MRLNRNKSGSEKTLNIAAFVCRNLQSFFGSNVWAKMLVGNFFYKLAPKLALCIPCNFEGMELTDEYFSENKVGTFQDFQFIDRPC